MKMVAGSVGRRLGSQAPYLGDYLKEEGLVAALGVLNTFEGQLRD